MYFETVEIHKQSLKADTFLAAACVLLPDMFLTYSYKGTISDSIENKTQWLIQPIPSLWKL